MMLDGTLRGSTYLIFLLGSLGGTRIKKDSILNGGLIPFRRPVASCARINDVIITNSRFCPLYQDGGGR